MDHPARAIKVIAFDLDGTLADSFPVFIRAVEATLKRRFSPQEVADLRQHSMHEAIKILKIKKWQLPWLIAKGMREVDRHQDEIAVFPDIPSELQKLRQSGYRLCIVSSHSTKGIKLFLKKYEMEQYVERTYGRTGLSGKPKALKSLLRQLRIEAHECIYVGDEIRDIEAADRVGIRCLAVAWGFTELGALKRRKPYILLEPIPNLSQ